jgi:BlaI family transcriptional regulator, penicillinase repressor
MANQRTYRLGDLQLRIMKVLWAHGPCTVAEVQQILDGEPLAYTTVATMLRKMEDRHLVQHRQEGRRFVYEPLASDQEVTTDMAGDLVDRLFAGSLADAVCHLLETREISRGELARLEELIAKHKKRR